MKRRTLCVSAMAALGATALPFGRAFSAVSEMPADRINETYGGNFERLVALA